MTFWADPQMEPKRGYRWLLYMGGIEPYYCKSVQRPKLKNEAIEHVYLNHVFKFPTIIKWEPISVVVVDPVNPDMSKTMYDLLRASGYELPDVTSNGPTAHSISKRGAVSAIGTVRFQQLAPNSLPIDTFWLKNAWISDIDFGDYTYEDAKILELKLTMVYDWANFSSIGKAVPGIPFGTTDANFGP